ncbi:pantoate--beta-alanine ligase [Effusibacillus dendaii]|uniref:Pantothenate synthetase n=1 Tax=Effusibacillus dendaii TaxID=2743772 RepID=A0A7I8D5Q8_9BACL|nr:pantoate--beta-alanine ligase [Effusibacillus dendaii]BCJ85425.1 pantoate--beta-alanine ligase [Effusibacillus dendaii]
MKTLNQIQILHTIDDIRRFVKQHRADGRSIGLVPTMGSLHEGHLALARQAKQQCDIAVMSIFVNPLQFGPAEDFDRYPRNLENDAKLAETAQVDAIFAPSVREMYPNQQFTYVDVELLTENLCGASRPGHFRGVTTVVSKLFHIVLPDKAFFGQKDAQQLRVIQQMTEDLNMPVEIVPCPIVREPDGLAMSSRNVFLSPEERKQALSLFRSLQEAEMLYRSGERSAQAILNHVAAIIKQQPLADIDYIKIVDAKTLSDVQTIEQKALLALAVRFGQTRLIDNTFLD